MISESDISLTHTAGERDGPPINSVQDRHVFGLDSYQRAATEFAIYPGKGTFHGVIYTVLKLNGEAGEIAEKIGKVLRDDAGVLSREKHKALLLELGDVLWYIAALGNELGYSLCEIANGNIKKLADRSARGKLQGSGDNR